MVQKINRSCRTVVGCPAKLERAIRRTLADSWYEEVRKHLLVAMSNQAGCMESIHVAIKASLKEKTHNVGVRMFADVPC